MSGDLLVIGVDPGPIPGIVALQYHRCAMVNTIQHRVFQTDPAGCLIVVEALLDRWAGEDARAFIAVEKFVIGHRSSRSSTAGAGAVTRHLIGALRSVFVSHMVDRRIAFVERAAGEVKPWATDRRLDKAGLIKATQGMRHARDAARHALFAAVKDGGQADPMSQSAARSAATPDHPRATS